MDFSCVNITGPDAESFLQRQASNEVTKLNADEGNYIALLDPKGKIKSLGYLVKKSNQEFYLITKNAEQVKNHLEKFVITEDVVIAICDAGKLDPHASSLLRMTELEDFSEDDTLIKLDLIEKYVSFTKGCFPGQEVLSKFKNIGMKKREERSQKITEEALEIFARAQEMNQDGAYGQAIELLRKALTENPKNEDAYESLGVILAKQGKITDAIKVMHQLEMINPNSIMAQTNLSIFYMKLGDKETAEEHKAKGTILQFDAALKK
jgi:glycine cleavage system aminomethyltransferase T